MQKQQRIYNYLHFWDTISKYSTSLMHRSDLIQGTDYIATQI